MSQLHRRCVAWALVALIVLTVVAMAWVMPTPVQGMRMSRSWASNWQPMEPVFMYLSWFSAVAIIVIAALLDDDLWGWE